MFFSLFLCGIRKIGHSRGYFCSLRSKNISLPRLPLGRSGFASLRQTLCDLGSISVSSYKNILLKCYRICFVIFVRDTENRSLSWIFLFASLQKYLTPSTPTRSLWLRFASPDFVRPRFDFRIQLQKYTSQMLSHLFRYFCAGYGNRIRDSTLGRSCYTT